MSYTNQEMEDANVVTVKVSTARELTVVYGDDDDHHTELNTAIDAAQAPVFAGDVKRALVIIEIVSDS